jgi:hypothetical protein
MSSREELERRLAKLDAEMPQLLAQYVDQGDFMEAFSDRADEITDDATGEDADWIFSQVDQILERHGFPANPDDLPTDE